MLQLASFSVQDKSLTVDHVMPQSVKSGSGWEKAFPDEAYRKEQLHRLGNLVLLDRSKNIGASNLDFKEKKEKVLQDSRKPSVRLLAILHQLEG